MGTKESGVGPWHDTKEGKQKTDLKIKAHRDD